MSEASDFKIENGVLVAYSGFDNTVIIPDTVTVIGKRAFLEVLDLEEVIIPNTVTVIEENAFALCSSLKSVIFSESLTEIGMCAFYNCMRLENVTLPDSIKNIAYGAFCDCYRLQNIVIPASAVRVGQRAFAECSSLCEVVVSNPNTLIEESAFDLVASAVNIRVEAPNNGDLPHRTWVKDGFFVSDGVLIKYLGDSETAIIPDGIGRIGEGAFCCCKSMKNVVIPGGVTSIGDNAFDTSGLTEIVIPETVMRLGMAVFSGCCDLRRAVIPGSVGEIQDSAFEFCTNLLRVDISEGVTDIGDCAFAYCDSLCRLNIPESVTCVGRDAFYGVREVYFYCDRIKNLNACFNCNRYIFTSIAICERMKGENKNAAIRGFLQLRKQGKLGEAETEWLADKVRRSGTKMFDRLGEYAPLYEFAVEFNCLTLRSVRKILSSTKSLECRALFIEYLHSRG